MSLFPGLSWNNEILKRGFKGVFVAFLFWPASLRAISFMKFSIENFLDIKQKYHTLKMYNGKQGEQLLK